jgi:segregation and condensation protein B
MPPQNLQSALEALLFSSDQPLPLSLLSESLDTGADDVLAALKELDQESLARGAGVQVREIAGGWIFVTAPEHAEWVGRLLRGKKRMRLSRAALETMAIIAYKQPVTKSEVEAIRGVDSTGVLATLLERNLVTIRGRSKVVGRPLLYGTTPEFLDYFGLRDLTELPRPEELRALVAAREPEQLEISELDAMTEAASALPKAGAPETMESDLLVEANGHGDDEDEDDEFEDDDIDVDADDDEDADADDTDADDDDDDDDEDADDADEEEGDDADDADDDDDDADDADEDEDEDDFEDDEDADADEDDEDDEEADENTPATSGPQRNES